VDDIVEYITRSLSKKKYLFKNNIYNICASKPKKIIDLVNIIGSNLKVKPIIKFKPKRKGEMLKTYGSNKKLLKEFGKKKFTKFEIGIKKTIKYFKKYNY
jgi:nucleoside-diphosphate-sugar epimerase